MEKKVLIITYYWPPAGGPGVQRWLKFVKYLPEFGFKPIVYIPENPTYPIIDRNLANDVANNVTIIKRKIIEPYALASVFAGSKVNKISSGIIPAKKKQSLLVKLALWVRGNLFVPDARILWVKPSVEYLEKYITANNIDTIITSGPPHSLHLIGERLKKKLAVRWIADFRDPWTTIGYHKELRLSRYAAKKHLALERQILNAADNLIVTSKTTGAEFARITSKPIEVITNGYDDEPVVSQALDSKFSLAHIGSLLSERNPELLWKVLGELITELEGFKDHFELKLIGTVSQEVLDSLAEHNLSAFVNNLGYVTHSEAVMEQRRAQVLLLVEINSPDTKSIIPGKVFEYITSGRPIIAIGPQDSDFAEIITDTNTGFFTDYSGHRQLKEVLISYFEQFKVGTLKVNGIGVQKYSRRQLTGQLANLLSK